MRAFALAGLATLLAACAGQPTRTAAPLSKQEQAAHVQAYEARRASLRGAWALTGRIAVSANGRGGSGRIDWTQAGDRYDIALSAPVTRQSWRLSGDAVSARLEGLEGGAREGSDATELLRQATGWTIPVDCLSNWVLGFTCPGSDLHESAWDAEGRPTLIVQHGWMIEYQEWHAAADGQPALPRRMFARQQAHRATVRLVIDDWQPAAAPVATFSEPSANEPLRKALAALNLPHPQEDVRLHLAQGDFRPVGVCGYSCEAPGVSFERVQDLGGLRVIEGTSDVIHDRAMQVEAERYAARYNQILLESLPLQALRRRRPAHISSAADDLGLPSLF